jgi:hypothetical protein
MNNGFPSLARFQFLLWTFIVLFAVLGVLLIRMFMGISGIPNDIPENLLILTGISIAVPFVSNPISGIKYGERKPPTGTLRDEDRRRLATMLMENEKPTVSRFQMFAWTIISIIVYLGFFLLQTIFLLTDVNELEVPDIPQIFVYLMGLSQAGYVGVKGTISKSLTVTQVLPKEARINEDVIIVGTNFGPEKGSVFFEDGPKDIVGNQVPVPPETNIKEWQETRIHIKVPSGLRAGDYYIRVENRGLVSYKGGGKDDEARFTMLKAPLKVLNTIPTDGATEVPVTSLISATFSEPMSGPTINENTFTVRKDGEPNPIKGDISLNPDSKTAIFDPKPDLDPNTKYTAEINEGAKDLAGSALVSAKRWSFKTTTKSQ